MQAVIVAGCPGPSRYMSAVKRKSLAPLAIELVLQRVDQQGRRHR
jgi:hypothetical protein